LHLTHLHIRRFRNIDALDWTPPPGVSLIYGENAQGKTNLLEAIHYALLGRSFRTRRDEETLPWSERAREEDATILEAEIARRAGIRRHKVALTREGKRVFVDGSMISRLGELWGGAAVVTFSPGDADLFRDSPARRRRLVDQLLCQASPVYLDHLQRYQQALKQTNAVLRIRRDSQAQAEAFYPMLAESGAALMRMRSRYFEELASGAAALFAELGGEAEFDIRYDPAMKIESPDELGESALASAIRARLAETHAESERLGMLASGPHRDDLKSRLGGRDLARFGSQGQHRLAALTLKLAAAGQFETSLGEPPILLLDDFGSELDARRRSTVLSRLRGRMQTFVTTTQLDEFAHAGVFDEIKEMSGGNWRDSTQTG
jgi:DNA replication and repair protein RecF